MRLTRQLWALHAAGSGAVCSQRCPRLVADLGCSRQLGVLLWEQHVWGVMLHIKQVPTLHFSLPDIILLKEKSEEEERNPFHSLLLFSQKLQILSTKPPSFLAGLRLLTDGTGDEKDRSL